MKGKEESKPNSQGQRTKAVNRSNTILETKRQTKEQLTHLDQKKLSLHSAGEATLKQHDSNTESEDTERHEDSLRGKRSTQAPAPSSHLVPPKVMGGIKSKKC